MPLPELAYDEMRETREALHLYLQIAGKVKLAHMPQMNQNWHAPFYPTARGLTTGLMEQGLEIRFDLVQAQARVLSARGRVRSIPLENQTVQGFYRAMMNALDEVGASVQIDAKPYDIPWISTTPFDQDTEHGPGYTREHALRFFSAWTQIYQVMLRFRAGFSGKASDIGLFWHHMDLSLSLYSGRPATPPEGPSRVLRESLTEEVFTTGFALGDDNMQQASFYAWTYPPPQSAFGELRPAGTSWQKEGSSAFLYYGAIAPRDDWEEKLPEFFQSTYESQARAAGWDLGRLRYEPL